MARRGEKLPWEEKVEEKAEESGHKYYMEVWSRLKVEEPTEENKKRRKIKRLKAALEKKDWGWLEQALSYCCSSEEEEMKLAADALGFAIPPRDHAVCFQVAAIMAELKQK